KQLNAESPFGAAMFVEPAGNNKFIIAYVSSRSSGRSGKVSIFKVDVYNENGETINQIAIPMPFKNLNSFKYVVDGDYLNVFIPSVLKREEVVNRKILGKKKELTDKALFITYYKINLIDGQYETYFIDLGNPERNLSHLYVSQVADGDYYIVAPWFIKKKSGLKKTKRGSITLIKIGLDNDKMAIKEQFIIPVQEGVVSYILNVYDNGEYSFIIWSNMKATKEVNTSKGTTRFKVKLEDARLTTINKSSRQHKEMLLNEDAVYLYVYPSEEFFNPLSFSKDLPQQPLARFIPLSDNKMLLLLPYLHKGMKLTLSYSRAQKGSGGWRATKPALVHPNQVKNKLYSPGGQSVYFEKDKKLLYVFWRKKWKTPVLSIHKVNF
ncbi:MAG: hypothetical protein GXO48_07915, partial [Chlorobi bacterium]|nr:hypothetical protein [Chlorobiota bacterium]